MAWLYLLLVLLGFYTPIVGLGPLLLDKDIEINIAGLRLPIPFTGSFKLLAYSLLTWWLLWSITRWIEQRTEFDIFYWLDRGLPFLHLRERWIYATRPAFSIQLAVRLAKIGMAISLGKAIGALLLGTLLAVIVPKLIQSTLPGLIGSLLLRFPEAGWAENLAGWLSGPLMEWLAGSVVNWLQDALDHLLKFRLHTSLLAISILTLLANQAYQRECAERYRLDVERIQKGRKQKQAFLSAASLVL
jgi:hypothetical protein